MEPITFAPKERTVNPEPLWWDKHPRHGFTRFCAQHMQAEVPLDDVSDAEVIVMVQRQDRQNTLIGLQQARRNDAIRRAIVLSRN